MQQLKPFLTLEGGTDSLDEFPMFVRKIFTFRDSRLLGVWDEWLVFVSSHGVSNEDLIFVDSSGMEVGRFPIREVNIQGISGICNGRVIMNSKPFGLYASDIVAYTKTGKRTLLQGAPFCRCVWKERLVTCDGKVELWEWKDPYQDLQEVQLSRTHQFDVGAIPYSATVLRDTILVATYERGLLECSIDGDVLRVILKPHDNAWFSDPTSIVEWKGFIFTLYYHEGYAWDKDWNLLRTVPHYDLIHVWNDELLCCNMDRYSKTCSIWNICSWSTSLHHRYPREVRDAIRTWLTYSRRQRLPRDIIFLVVEALVDRDLDALMKRTRLEKSIHSYE